MLRLRKEKKENKMKIKKIISQHRRDFTAIYICEHCEKEKEGSGYDDKFFHQDVIPKMKCDFCGKQADEAYFPLATKYGEHEVI